MIPPLRRVANSIVHTAMSVLLLGGCVTGPTAPLAAETPIAQSQVTETVADQPIFTAAPLPAVDTVPPTAAATATATVVVTPQPIKITIQSSQAASSSAATVKIATLTPTPIPLTSPATPEPQVDVADVEPVIFVGYEVPRACGRGLVAAADGHQLYATPRLLYDNSNFLALLSENAQVDIIDCNLWTDAEDVSWLAVRTAEGKFGWMLVQPDKFYITLFPVAQAPVRSLTGVPAGATIAWVPPPVDGCKNEPASTEAVATSIGIDLIPVVGDLKGIQEAATGCDGVTGESLGDWRWLGLLGIIGLSEVALLRHGDEVIDGARIAGNLDVARHGDEAVMITGRNLDTAADVARAANKLDEVAEAAPAAVRAAQPYAGLSDETLAVLAKFEQPCSFSGETLVTTSNGPRPIRQIQPGDHVLAYHESTDVTDFYTVTATFAHLDMTVVNLDVSEDTLSTTPEHPFYVNGEWIPARDLAIDYLLSSAAGVAQPIEAIRIEQRPQVMYNLTVAEAHTYFVGDGEWLVHNACSRVLRTHLSVPNEWEQNKVAWQAHHIIPGQFEKHPFVENAAKGGWKIDGESNGIALPVSDEQAQLLCRDGLRSLCVPTHRGYHRQYSENVESQLDSLNRRAVNEGWSEDYSKVSSELQKLADRLKKEILSRPAGTRLN